MTTTVQGPYTHERILVTPEIAAEWIETQEVNRKVSQNVIERYTKAMKEKRWTNTGEFIKFDWDGRLIDGQHRLWAVIESGIKIHLDVLRGLDPKSQDYMDTGKTRTQGDTLSMRGIVNANEVATAVGLFFEYSQSNGNFGSKSVRLDNSKTLTILGQNQGIVESVRTIANNHTFRRFGSAGMLGFCHYVFEQIDSVVNNDFWNKLATGLELGSRDPIYFLRERLLANKVAQAKLSRTTLIALIIKAWNAHHEGRKIGVLRWKASGTGSEAFPRAK